MSEIVNVATHSFSLKQMCDGVAERSADLGALSAQQLKIARDALRRAEDLCRNQGVSRTEHCGRSCANATTGAVIQKAQGTVDVPLLQCIDTDRRCSSCEATPESTVKTPQKTAPGLHDEVQRNQDGQEATFCLVQDREQEADCRRR